MAFGAALLDHGRADWPLLAWAVGLAVATVATAALVPWRRLPRAASLVPPLGCELLVALLRHAEGGGAAAITPLALVPVLWVGLTLGLVEVAAIVASTLLVFALPIAIFGPPLYAETNWQTMAVRAAVAALVGLAANRITEQHRRQTELLDRLVATQTAIATSALGVGEVLGAVVEEAMRLTCADAAHVAVPDGDDLVSIAVGGTAPPAGLRFPIESSLSGRAFTTQAPLLCRDTETEAHVDRAISRSTGARSLAAVPLLHDGRAMGVLAISHHTRGALSERDVQALSLLGSLIGTALVRAELISKLAEQAVTDDLTGLPNRRAFHEHLTLAFKRASRAGEPLSVVLLDLDGFKQINDRLGHVEGDRLLANVAARLRGSLREMDILGRLGGDEFGVILEGADAMAAADVVARLPETGASAGVATWDGDEDAASLLARADADMYRQKRLRSVAV